MSRRKILSYFRSEEIGVRSAKGLQLLTHDSALLTPRLKGAAHG